MRSQLKILYDRLYTPPRGEQLEEAVDLAHKQLIDRLGKQERKLVLQIIDDKDCIAEKVSFDSFVAGFHLAWSLMTELQLYQENRCLMDKQATFDGEKMGLVL